MRPNKSKTGSPAIRHRGAACRKRPTNFMPRRKKNRSVERQQAPQPISQRSWSWEHVGLAMVLAAVVVIYWPACYGAQLWDDDANMTRPELQAAHGLFRIWFEPGATQQYYPLLHSAFWIEH